MKGFLRSDTRKRRLFVAVAIYILVTAVMFACAARSTLVEHTRYNHFALLAEGWLNGHLYLADVPPAYASNNDFAKFGGHWYVAFPAFPAVLIAPLVYLAGSAEHVRDGQFFIWLSGLGPAILFLALEKLRRSGRAAHSVLVNAALSVFFAFGTVYFFTAVQGTVWFAAHVVGVALTALYLLFALEAERPFLAGLMLGLGFWTRTPILFAFPLLLVEALRVHSEPSTSGASRLWARLTQSLQSLRLRRLIVTLSWFVLPVVLCLLAALWHNKARFGHYTEFGYQYLTVAWQARMKKWGLFHYHFLAKNLGVIATSLPWIKSEAVPFRINVHGLALWFTTPFYLWLVWPKDKRAPHLALWLTVALVAVPTLFYQNTGWEQFGYRFSNDYAVFLFALLAINGRRLGWWFAVFALWAIVVNSFGALTFGREHYKRFYYSEGSQKTLYEND